MFNNKKRHLSKAVKDAYKVIWETEYKRWATLLQREKERQTYDQLKSRMSILESQIANEKERKTMPEGDIARLEDDKVRLQKDIDRAKERMDMLDTEVYGSKPTNEYPEGIAGLDHKIDAWHERVALLKKYIKSL